MLSINPNSGTPIYRQMVDQVQRLILSGQLEEGANLPSVREVAEMFTVNPMTISKAYAMLEQDGWLVRSRGKPMTVASISPRLKAQGGASDTESNSALLKRKELEPLIDALVLAARQLDVSTDELCEMLRQAMVSSSSNAK